MLSIRGNDLTVGQYDRSEYDQQWRLSQSAILIIKNHEIDGNVIFWRKLCVVDHSVRVSMKSAAKCVN